MSRIMASAHTDTHSSQMHTPFGPLIIAFTCSGVLPQNAQWISASSESWL